MGKYRSGITLADMLDQTARICPDRTGLICDEGNFTFRDISRRADAVAKAFLDLGIAKGDRVALLAYNCHWYVDLFYAAARLGFILVPINYRLSPQEILFILEDCKPETVIVEDDFYGILDEIRAKLPFIHHFIGAGEGRAELLNFEDIATGESTSLATLATPEDVLCILYTSGTTGFPKGAMLTNKSIVANMVSVESHLSIEPSDINMVMTPLFHSAAIWPVFSCIQKGVCSIIPKRFNAKESFRLIEKYKVTFCHPVATQVITMLDEPEIGNYDLSSLRVMQVTVNLPLEAYRRAVKAFGAIVVSAYGLTEASPMVTVGTLEEARCWGQVVERPAEMVPHFGSSGRVLPGGGIRLVDEQDADVPLGKVGEILVRGDNVMRGYWNRPEVNADVLRGGWYHSGDLGRLDSDGYLYFVERKSGMIKSGGENVYPREVEQVILAHPSIAECAVIGVPDAKWGETVKALVVLRHGCHLSESEVMAHCKIRLASYKKPTSVEFVDSLPRTLTGKVATSVLKQRYCNPSA